MRHKPLLFATLALIICTSMMYVVTIRASDGHFTYGLDDAYIHLSLSKNLVNEGNFGINSGEFASASSSIGWTLLLALGFAVVGNVLLLPLYLNFIAGLGVLAILYYIYQQWLPSLSDFWQTLLLTASIVLIPLPILIFIGMEHTLHVALTLVALYVSIETLARPLSAMRWWLLLVGPCLVAARYEGLFLMFVVCCILLFQRRIVFAFVTGLFSLLPVIIFGLISLYNGEYVLPNSIVVKALVGNNSFLTGLLANAILAPYLLTALLWLVTYYFLRFRRDPGTITNHTSLVIIVTGGTLFLHFMFAKFGWFFRYEAYLVALLVVTGPVVAEHFHKHRVQNAQAPPRNRLHFYGRMLSSFRFWFLETLLMLVIMRAPLSWEVPTVSKAIYSQHYQMALFRQTYYQTEPVALNDIGYVSYVADAPILDLVGLANHEIAALRYNREYSIDGISHLVDAQNIKIIMVDESWFVNGLPDQWVKAGEWQFDQPDVSPTSDVVSFFAVDIAVARSLQANLDEFASELPPNVTYRRTKLP